MENRTPARSRLELTAWQKQDVNECVRIVRETAKRLAETRVKPSAPRSQRLDALKSPRMANAVGLFGARGSGKTTTVLQMLETLDPHRKGELVDVNSWVLIRHPLDLSQLPRDVPQGLAVLHWLRSALEERQWSYQGSDARAATAAFERACESFACRQPGAEEVARQVALGVNDYAKRSLRRLDGQMTLPDLVSDWLDKEIGRKDIAGFIVVVDDADLCRAEGQESLVWSLLDELHQSQLLLIVLGDYQRLEANVAKIPNRPIDASTAEELWEKAIPESQRVMMRTWRFDQRDEFGRVLDDTRETFSERTRRLFPNSPFSRDLRLILPASPRALRTVYELLEVHSDLSAFLPRFARVAGSHELSDHIAIATTRWLERARWSRSLAGSSETEALSWRRMAHDAPVYEAAILDLIPNNGDELGLEELSESRQARWTELLMDIELLMPDRIPRRLINRHATLSWILRRLTPLVSISTPRAADYFVQHSETKPAELYWMRWRNSADGVGYTVGIGSVLSYFGSRRMLTDALVAEYLMVQGIVRQEVVPSDPILPRSIRCIVLFLTALELIDWAALAQSHLLRSPGSIARLAAGLTWVSYLRALRRVDEDPKIPAAWTDDFSSWDATRIDQEFSQLAQFDDPVPAAKDPRSEPLWRAWDTFRRHPVFVGLVPNNKIRRSLEQR